MLKETGNNLMNNLAQTAALVNSAALFPAQINTLEAPAARVAVAPHVRIDNAFIDRWMPRLAGMPWSVLTLLARYKGADAEAHPCKATLAKMCDVTVPTIERAIKKLVKFGLIESRAWFYPDSGRQGANRYYFLATPHNLNPLPLPKMKEGRGIKNGEPKQRNKKEVSTQEQSSANAEIVVADSKSSFVEGAADNTLLANLDALGALNKTTQKLCQSQPEKAARQIENLRREKSKRTINSPAAWFNSAMKNEGYELRTAQASTSPAMPQQGDVANADARRIWRASERATDAPQTNRPQTDVAIDGAPLEKTKSRQMLIAQTLAQMTPQKRLSYEAATADLEPLAACQYLDRSAPNEFALARRALAKPQ